MFEDFWKLLKTVVTLADDIQKYNAELKEIRKELRDLTIIVHALAQDNKHTKEQNESKYQLLLSELNNKIQSIEKGLPPATKKPKAK